ncbi:hypothetical protein [Spirosoma harenae]
MKPRTYLLVGLSMIVWLVVAQGCMRFRTTDTKAVAEFAKLGLTLVPEQMSVANRTLRIYWGCG